MAHKCPACSADVPDVVPQAEFTRRLAEKTAQTEAAQAKAAALETKAAGYDTATAELTAARAELGKVTEGATRYQTLAAKSVTDPKVTRAIQAVYDLEMGDRAKKDQVPFADWVNTDAAAHPATAHFFAAKPAAPAAAVAPVVPAPGPTPTPAAAAPAAPAPVPAPVNMLPSTAPAAAPPGPAAKMNNNELGAKLATMSRAETFAFVAANKHIYPGIERMIEGVTPPTP